MCEAGILQERRGVYVGGRKDIGYTTIEGASIRLRCVRESLALKALARSDGLEEEKTLERQTTRSLAKWLPDHSEYVIRFGGFGLHLVGGTKPRL